MTLQKLKMDCFKAIMVTGELCARDALKEGETKEYVYSWNRTRRMLIKGGWVNLKKMTNNGCFHKNTN